ncbi:MAG: 30S ribosomal protein S13 [bacterium]|nr:30S ribosomal protein S13 [bacterium]
MARIAGINIPDNKRVEIALTYIYGIGQVTAKKILSQANIKNNPHTNELATSEIDRIREIIDRNYKVEGEAKMAVTQNIKRLKEINAYRGLRHTKGLPVRGQRTKTNSRTKRGKRISVGSGRRKSAEKT